MTDHPLDANGLARLDAAMQGYVDRGEAAGFVTALSRGGATVIQATGVQDLESGVPMAEDTIFRIASLTKPVMAVAAMQLIETGELSLDDPIATWLPELANPRVLRAIDADLDDTVPVIRPLVVRDLMR
jgi:CubicO group peptidase (beta-lactamase class C family)